MFVQCFVNTNYNGWDHVGGICKIWDNFSPWFCWRWLWKAWMTTSTLGRPLSWFSLAPALRTFTLVLGLSGLASPPPWPSCLPSSCTRSWKPGVLRIHFIFRIFYRLLLLFDYYSLTITSNQDSPARNPQRQHNLKDKELGEWEETFCCGIAITSLYILHFGD